MSDFTFKDLLFEAEDEIGILTINRPHRLNALAKNTKAELRRFFEQVNERTDVKVIILTGAGEKAFCAGTDVKEMKDFDSVQGEQLWRLEHRLNEAIRRCSKPVIAAVNGHALGSGCLLTITCDYSVVSSEAKLGFPEIKVGVPSAIEIALLPKIVGIARARELVYFGESITPEAALGMGLINRVVQPKEVMKTAREMANKFLQQPPTVLRLQKEIVNNWIETDFTGAVESSIYATGIAFSTGEPKTWMEKFLNGGKQP